MIGCVRKANYLKHQRKVIFARNFRNYDKDKMLKELHEVNWSFLYAIKNVNDVWILIKEKLKNVFDKHVPVHEKRIQSRNCPWLTHDIAKIKNERDQLKRKADKIKSPEVWQSYKKSS